MRRYVTITFALISLVGGFFAWKAEQPIPISPSSDW